MKIRYIIFGATLPLTLIACGAESPEFETIQDSVIAGSNPVAARNYEDIFVKVVRSTGAYCSGTLLGNTRTSANWVLTAKHCFGSTSDSVTVKTTNGTVIEGKRIIFAPRSADNQFVDAALIELVSSVPVSAGVYFTNSDAQEMIGKTVRCYGYGKTAWDAVAKQYTGGGLHWADFTVKNHDGKRTYYQLDVPNSKGQALAPGDSGGPCFSVPPDNATAIVVTGVQKSGSTSGVPTYNAQTSAATFSDWVRGYVSRPN